MKKVAVLTLIATLNLGGAAGEFIFSHGFDSGWPNAWAEAVGWSAFVVKDSTGALVGSVVGGWTQGDDWRNPTGVPLVATIIDGRTVVLKVSEHALFSGRKVYFKDSDCQGEAWICVPPCSQDPIDPGDAGELATYPMGEMYGIGPGNVLYRAEPPNVSPPNQAYESLSFVGPGRDYATSDCYNNPGVTAVSIYAADPVIDLDSLFTPPFTVE